MEITDSVTLRGSRENVLRDAMLLHEFLATLSTVVPSSAVEPQVDDSWPVYKDQLLSYRGRSATISAQQGVVLSLLLEARGGVVSRDTLVAPFLRQGVSRNELNVNVSRLRKALAESLPSITVDTAGNGYRLSVA